MPDPAVIINVDDNEPSRYARSRILSHAGFVVYDAATGAGCLELVEKREPDLVLLDINLPDLNGIEVCRTLKSSPGGASVIVVQISATATMAPHATEALNSGADAYLAEPVDPDVLVATVRALLRLRAAERALTLANSRLEAVNCDLKKSNESLEQFAYVASHDLQEPLRTVTTFASLLERSLGGRLTGEEQQYVEYIVGGANRMRTLIDDLLHYSQIGQSPAATASVDLNAVFAWAKENLRELIAQSGAELTSENLPCVRGDEAQLCHVFQNLIGNAIKYRNPDVTPRVHFAASLKDGRWLVRVEDNGIGIEREYWDYVFIPFKRLHGRDIPGTGIGLAVCRRVIEAHGGRIWLDSTFGKGSAFSFTLPPAS
jgi:signal transduction histidine kinase